MIALRLEVAHKEHSNAKIKPVVKVGWISICRQTGQLQQPVAVVGATKVHRGAFAVRIEALELLRLVAYGMARDHDSEACKGVAIIEKVGSNLFHVEHFFINTVFLFGNPAENSV